jgi:hypothetical protein
MFVIGTGSRAVIRMGGERLDGEEKGSEGEGEFGHGARV